MLKTMTQIVTDDYTKEKKQITREGIFHYLNKVTYPLLFPGPQQLDVKYLIKKNKLSHDAKIYAVERDNVVQELIKDFFDQLPYEYELHCDELNKWKLKSDYHDFAWLDFMGWLTALNLSWTEQELSPKLQVGSVVAVTFSQHVRWDDPWLKNAQKYVKRNHTKRYRRFLKDCGYNDTMAAFQEFLFFECALGKWKIYKQNSCHYREDGKRTNMVVAVAQVIDIMPKSYKPLTIDQIDEGAKQMEKTGTKSVKKISGKKSVDPALAEKRSEAARKAAATRRANQQARIATTQTLAEKRSAAARKAWATRRANSKTAA